MLLKSLQSFTHSFSAQGIQLDFGTAATTAKLPGATGGDPNTAFGALIAQGLNIALVIGAVAVLLFLILGAIEWITAGGDSGKIQKAREKITQAVIGLVVLVSSWAILMFVQQLLGVRIFNEGSSYQSPSLPDQDYNAARPCSTISGAFCATTEVCGTSVLTQVNGACGVGQVCCVAK